MPRHTDQSVAVIVLNWNNADDTIACLESLLVMDRDVAVYLVDNASTDGSPATLREWGAKQLPSRNLERAERERAPYVFLDEQAPPATTETPGGSPPTRFIRLLQSGANLGYAGGNNVGLKAAEPLGYDFFWILNNDTRVAPDALTQALDRMVDDPGVGLCGSTLVYLDNPDLVQCRGGGSFQTLTGRPGQIGQGSHVSDPVDRSAIERRMRYVSGAAALVRRSFLEDVGLMDEGYFLYFEELDWATRARGKFRLGYAPHSIVFHKVGASIGTDDRGGEGSDLAAYYMTRNRVRYCWRHSRVSLLFVTLDVARAVVSNCLRGNRRRAGVILAALLRLPTITA